MVERMVPLDQLIRPDDDIISAQHGPAGSIDKTWWYNISPGPAGKEEENWEVQSW